MRYVADTFSFPSLGALAMTRVQFQRLCLYQFTSSLFKVSDRA